jgi:UrcA family protein
MKALIPFVALACIAGPAPAQQAPRQARVSYADLDLSKPEDVRTLKARVTRAVASVCGARPGASPEQEDRYQRCRAATAATLRPQLIALGKKTTDTMLAAR